MLGRFDGAAGPSGIRPFVPLAPSRFLPGSEGRRREGEVVVCLSRCRIEWEAQIQPKAYLEIVLRRVEGGGEGAAAKNQIRESIRSLFPDRDCCMLVRPVNDESLLVQLDTLPQTALRPEFRDVCTAHRRCGR